MVTEEFYDIALIEAREKDEERSEAIKNGKVHKLGLLHGIPISIKDQFNERGKINTVGCSHYADHVATDDALVVHLLKV